MSIIKTVNKVAAENTIEPLSVALAWLTAKNVFLVIGARTESQLRGNLAAVDARLTDNQMGRLDDASAISLGYPYELLAEQRRQIGITAKKVLVQSHNRGFYCDDDVRQRGY